MTLKNKKRRISKCFVSKKTCLMVSSDIQLTVKGSLTTPTIFQSIFLRSLSLCVEGVKIGGVQFIIHAVFIQAYEMITHRDTSGEN